MKVPSLIEFYNNQNALAVQAAGQTASLKTQANIESARLGAEAKRAAQEEQLARFQQLMENMRQQRALTSAEGISMAQIQAENARATLGREEQGQERAFRQKLAEFEQAGAAQRQTQQLASAKEIAGMNIGAEEKIAAMKIASEAPEQEARTRLYSVQAEALGGPDIEGTINLLSTIATNRKELEKVLGGRQAVKDLATSLSNKLRASGVEPTSIPAVAQAEAPDVKQRVADLSKSLDTDFKTMQKRGAIQYIQQLQLELQTLISQGLVNDPRAAMKKLQAEAKRLGVTAEDLS